MADMLLRKGGKALARRIPQAFAQQGIEKGWRQLGEEAGQQLTGYDRILRSLGPETQEALRLSETTDTGPLHSTDVGKMRDLSNTEPDVVSEVLKDFEAGDYYNFQGGLRLIDETLNEHNYKSRANPQETLDAPAPEARTTRYDVEGKEGKKALRQGAKGWWEEQMERIGWDPKRVSEIDRSQYAPEGMYIDGEEYRWQGVTEYARNRKTLPTLTKVTQSQAQVGRLESEVIQTMGPAFRSKPVVLDALSEVVDPKTVHKHHILLIKVIEPWTRLANGLPRPKKQIKELIKALQAKNWYIGNIDQNLLWQQTPTHIGPEGSHGYLKGFTDVQGKPQGEKYIEGFGPTEIPGKTYDPKARHGFSNEEIARLANIKDTKELIASLLLFLDEAGGGEAMEGAAGLAQKNLEQRAVVEGLDVKSGDIMADRKLQNPRMQKHMKDFGKAIGVN